MNQPILIPGPPGPQGVPGVAGETGQRGSIWMWGHGTPDDALLTSSLINDKYLDVDSGDVWSIEPVVGGGSTWRRTKDHARRVG